MAQTIPNITVDDTAWVDINTGAGITVGNKMAISLQSSTWCRLYEGAVAPSVTSKDGEMLTDKRYPYSTATIPAGSLKIWAIGVQIGRTIELAVQEI